MSSEPIKVTIAGREYPVYPQKIGYLRNRLEKAAGALDLNAVEAEDLQGFVTSGTHHVYIFLRVFFPQLMPEWEFWGYGSPEAMERNELPEAERVEDERGADIPEIMDAFLTAIHVNRLDRMKGWADAVPFDSMKAMVRKAIEVKMAEAVEGMGQDPSSPGEPSSTD